MRCSALKTEHKSANAAWGKPWTGWLRERTVMADAS
jgi:hypothetical protein